jgi:Tol biopolymer transport system component
MRAFLMTVSLATLLAGAGLAAVPTPAAPAPPPTGQAKPPLLLPQEERHLRNIRQLTFGGENAEAYFSFDGTRLVLQQTKDRACDQIYSMKIDGSDFRLVSTGTGRTTCAFYTPDGRAIVYASTHLGGAECPPVPGREMGYVWPIYDTYDIFKVNVDGTGLTPLTRTRGYDAEATVARDGTIVFTSTRDGDMELYTMRLDGSDVRRLTRLPGPDGGAFFSADSSKIVFRGRHPEPGAELDRYTDFLKKALWQPTSLEIFVIDRDGRNLRQVTNTGAGANWAPYFSPDGKKVIYATNAKNPRGRNFDLYLINVDGTGLEQVTFAEEFDGFPMFSPDGRKLVFSSNRNASREGETNVFIADWIW